MSPQETILYELATDPYRSSGRYGYHFARGKLKYDPAFFSILREGLIGDGARVLDLGCGEGILLSTLVAGRQTYENGVWPVGWPAPPEHIQFHGIDLLPHDIARARTALGTNANLLVGDMRNTPFPESDAVVILDVLHYLKQYEQEEVLTRIRDCLGDSGRLLLRVADPHAGLRSLLTYLGDRFGTLLRGELWPRHNHRPISDWMGLLEKLGFSVSALPMSQGTPFSNVLLVADWS